MLIIPNGSWKEFIKKAKKKGRFHERNSAFNPKAGDYVILGENSCGAIIKPINAVGDMIISVGCVTQKVNKNSNLVEGYIQVGRGEINPS